MRLRTDARWSCGPVQPRLYALTWRLFRHRSFTFATCSPIWSRVQSMAGVVRKPRVREMMTASLVRDAIRYLIGIGKQLSAIGVYEPPQLLLHWGTPQANECKNASQQAVVFKDSRSCQWKILAEASLSPVRYTNSATGPAAVAHLTCTHAAMFGDADVLGDGLASPSRSLLSEEDARTAPNSVATTAGVARRTRRHVNLTDVGIDALEALLPDSIDEQLAALNPDWLVELTGGTTPPPVDDLLAVDAAELLAAASTPWGAALLGLSALPRNAAAASAAAASGAAAAAPGSTAHSRPTSNGGDDEYDEDYEVDAAYDSRDEVDFSDDDEGDGEYGTVSRWELKELLDDANMPFSMLPTMAELAAADAAGGVVQPAELLVPLAPSAAAASAAAASGFVGGGGEGAAPAVGGLAWPWPDAAEADSAMEQHRRRRRARRPPPPPGFGLREQQQMVHGGSSLVHGGSSLIEEDGDDDGDEDLYSDALSLAASGGGQSSAKAATGATALA